MISNFEFRISNLHALGDPKWLEPDFPRLDGGNSKFEISLTSSNQANPRATHPKTRIAWPRAEKFEIRNSKFEITGGGAQGN